MKEKIILGIIAIIAIVMMGYVFKDISVNQSYASNEYENRMIKIYGSGNGDRMYYDKETKVMYLFIKYGYGAGLTTMLDKDGKPLLYKEE